MREEYKNIPIPEELEGRVKEAVKLGIRKRRQYQMRWAKITASAAASIVLVINISPTLAQTLSDVPVLGGIVKVINFREYKFKGDRQEANIQVPQVEGIGNKDLENTINTELQEHADQVYEEFLKMAKEWEDVDSAAHYSVDMNYEVLTNTENVFAMRVNKVETMASANQQVKFYVIDKQKETALTLPTLFKDSSYIPIINEYVMGQMKEEMERNPDKIYWVGEDEFSPFTGIKPEQNFYINKDGKLVIYFEKYEVAPGAMGESEFVIPTEIIKDLLVDSSVIK